MLGQKLAENSAVGRKNVEQNSTSKKNAEMIKVSEKNNGADPFRKIVDGMTQFWKEDVKEMSREIVKDLKKLPEKFQEFKELWRTIDGMSIWRINRKFTKVALSREYMEEIMVDGTLVIQLAPKYSRELADETKKREIEAEIKDLEGFEVFRICILEDCKPIYKETLTEFGISRWLEVPLQYKKMI